MPKVEFTVDVPLTIEVEYTKLACGDFSIVYAHLIKNVDIHELAQDFLENDGEERTRAFDESVENYIDIRRNK